MTNDGLKYYEAESTIFKTLESELGIPVEFVDVDAETRTKLKISNVELQLAAILPGEVKPDKILKTAYEKNLSDPVRESTWLSHIVVKNLWPTLLIVGSNHVESVKRKAEQIGIHTVVLASEYGT